MPAVNSSLDSFSFLTDSARDMLHRRLRELVGVALIASAILLTAALASWSVQDPSLSHATINPVRNLLGHYGAIAADLLMQLLGLGALALVLPIAVWGWRLTSHRQLSREWVRLVTWIIAVMLAATFASCVPRTHDWPLPAGLGGVIGDGLLRSALTVVHGQLAGWERFLIASTTGAGAFVALAIASGFGFGVDPHADEEENEQETHEKSESRFAIWLGWVTHGLLGVKWRLTRWLARKRSGNVPIRRGEPRYAEASRATLAPDIEEEEGDEEEEEEEDEGEEAPPRKLRIAARRSSGGYTMPSLNLLSAPRASDRTTLSAEIIEGNANALESVLGDFGVRGEIINARPGPVVTLYELEPAPGIKSSRVIGLADDIARSMSALSARVAVVAGRNAIGIELPNPVREKVYLRELLASDSYQDTGARLPLCLGKTIGGEEVIVDLARMPHLLIAGTTGSGKSVAINTMILSLLYRLRPEQCRLIMVDPKMLELSVYDGIPHLLTPVVTDPKKAVVALKWAVREMEERYKKMSKLGVRNIDGYNARVADAGSKGETLTRTVHTGYDKESGEAIYEEEELELESLPHIVVIVDEMADLMMVAGKDIEGAVQRLAQMARAAGLHVILATQRPSVDVITGTIKANFPTRISFQVTSKIDSRTILGEQGAEQLLGQGDMLYMAGGGRISRVHGPFVSDEEVEKIVRHLKAQGTPQYLEAVTAGGEEEDEDGAVFDATAMGAGDATDLYQQAVQIVMRDRKASTSYIQRRLQIGYNRAASLMERMEHEGVVGQPNHAGKREILMGGEAE
jgi:DNA segregation ATPase FtsK/SpoIIIE, S-DNA-T family